MRELDSEKNWVPKNWCFWTVVLEKTLESPLDCKEIQPVHPKGDQSWVFIGRTDAEAETPILWPPHAKSWLIGEDPDAWRDWGQEEGTTEDEMVGWHHQLDGHEFESTLGVGDRQGGLACCNSWGRRVGHDWATELRESEEWSHSSPWFKCGILNASAYCMPSPGTFTLDIKKLNFLQEMESIFVAQILYSLRIDFMTGY